MKKIVILLTVLIITIGGGIYFFNYQKDTKNADITLVDTSDSRISYEIIQPEGKTVYLTENDLQLQKQHDVIDTSDMTNTIEVTYVLEYTNQKNSSEFILYNKKAPELMKRSKRSDEKKQIQFIPYKKITENKIGILVITDSESRLKQIEKNPQKAKTIVTSEDTLLEQSISIK
jgi:uncharacterized protein YxeA